MPLFTPALSHDVATYTVYIDTLDSNKIKLRNGNTGTVDYSGTDIGALLTTAIATVGQGTRFDIAPGLYNIASPIIIDANGISIVGLSGQVAVNLFTHNNTNMAQMILIGATTNRNGCRVDGLQLDGNQVNGNTVGHGIVVRGSDNTISNCTLKNMPQDSLRIDSADSTSVYENTIFNCNSMRSLGNGFWLSSFTGSNELIMCRVNGGTVTNSSDTQAFFVASNGNWVHPLTQYGFYDQGGENKFLICHSYFCQIGLHAQNGGSNQIIGGEYETNQLYGIEIHGTFNSQVNGVICYDNQFYDIYVLSAHNTLITNCNLKSGSPAQTNIQLQLSDHTHIDGNHINGVTTSGAIVVYQQNTNTVIANNDITNSNWGVRIRGASTDTEVYNNSLGGGIEESIGPMVGVDFSRIYDNVLNSVTQTSITVIGAHTRVWGNKITVSSSNDLLLDRSVGGLSKFSVDTGGNLTLAGTLPAGSLVGTVPGASLPAATSLVRGIVRQSSYNVKDYGAKGDAGVIVDAVMTSGSAILTSASALFSAAMVGLTIKVQSAGVGSGMLTTTVASYQSTTQVTLAVPASATISNRNATWGTDDTIAIQAAIDAAYLAGGGDVYLVAGRYLVSYTGSTPAFNNPCALRLKQAVSLRGAGKWTSILTLAPGSNCAVISNAQADAYYDPTVNSGHGAFATTPSHGNAEYVSIIDVGIDGNKDAGMLIGPTAAPSVTVVSGTPSVTNGNHYYAFSYQTTTSESSVGVRSNTAVIPSSGSYQVVVGGFSGLPTGSNRVGTGINLYRTSAGQVVPFFLVQTFTWAQVDTILAGSGTWTDTFVDGALSVVARSLHGIYLGMNPLFPIYPNGVDTEYDPHFSLRNVYVQRCAQTGIYEYGLTAAEWIACHAYNNDQYSFRPSSDSALIGCHSGTSGLHGFYVENGAVRLASCKAFYAGQKDNTLGSGFFISNCYGINIEGCEAQDNQGSGFTISGSQNCCVMGIADSNSRRGPSFYPAVQVFNSSYNQIAVRCFDRQSSCTQNSALRIVETNDSATNISIGNVCEVNDLYQTIGFTATLPTYPIDQLSKPGLTGNIVRVGCQDGIHSPGNISGTFTPDVYYLGGHVYGTLVGNLTIAAPLHPTSDSPHWGVPIEFVLTANSSGPYTLSWNSLYGKDPTDPNLSLLPANTTLRVTFVWNGTNWVQVAKSEGGTNSLNAAQLSGIAPRASVPAATSLLPGAVRAATTNPREYGALGDGVADDTTAIQAALDAAGAGGHVFVPAGTYLVSDMLGLPTGVHLQGAGPRKTIIQQQTANTPVVVSKSWPTAKQTLSPFWPTTTNGYTQVSDLALTGSSTGTGAHGLVLRDFYCRVRDVYVSSCGGHGFYLTPNNSSGAAVSGTLVENRFDRCKALACGTASSSGWGFFLGETQNGKSTDGYLTDCIIDAGNGTQPAGHVFIGAAAGWKIDGIHTYGNIGTSSIRVVNGYRTRISNLYIESYWQSGLHLSTSQETIHVSDSYIGRFQSNASGIGIEITSQSGFSPIVYIMNPVIGNNQSSNPTNITAISNSNTPVTATVMVGKLTVISGSNTGTVTNYGGTGSGSISTLY